MLVAVILGGQALAGIAAPAGAAASTGRVLGQTGFAYIGGLRTFAAAVLWNRLEPLWHGYYSTRPVEEVVQFLPTMRLVQILDPQVMFSVVEPGIQEQLAALIGEAAAHLAVAQGLEARVACHALDLDLEGGRLAQVLGSGGYDLVVCHHLLEYVSSPEAVLRASRTALAAATAGEHR